MHTLSLNTLLVLLIGLPLTVQATPSSDELLCEEIAEVLLEAVTFGHLTKETADHVIDGCYSYYLPNYL